MPWDVLLLVAGVLAAPMPAQMPAEIAVCFAPEQDCADFAARAIDAARRQILVAAYNLTTGSGIVEALVRALRRGVDVRLIVDKTTPCERKGGVEALANAGAPVWVDRGVRIAHAKTMVIDGRITLMGSYNWSRNAARNSEDLNRVASSAIAADYADHWRRRLLASVPFVQRQDWCRAKHRRDGSGSDR